MIDQQNPLNVSQTQWCEYRIIKLNNIAEIFRVCEFPAWIAALIIHAVTVVG